MEALVPVELLHWGTYCCWQFRVEALVPYYRCIWGIGRWELCAGQSGPDPSVSGGASVPPDGSQNRNSFSSDFKKSWLNNQKPMQFSKCHNKLAASYCQSMTYFSNRILAIGFIIIMNKTFIVVRFPPQCAPEVTNDWYLLAIMPLLCNFPQLWNHGRIETLGWIIKDQRIGQRGWSIHERRHF